MHTIYHIPGVKVGCTNNFQRRKNQYPPGTIFEVLLAPSEGMTDKEAGDLEWAYADFFGYKRGRHYLSCNSEVNQANADRCGLEGYKVRAAKSIATLGHQGVQARRRKQIENAGPEGLTAVAKKIAENLGVAGRSARSKKRAENLGAEKLIEIAKKGQATRRRNAEKAPQSPPNTQTI